MESAELEQIVSPELGALGFECVKCEVMGSGGSRVVRMYIDKPGGVSIKDCAVVSRMIGILLDRLDPFPGRYLLEVSSPGSNRPLTREGHFVRYIGRKVRIHQMSPSEGKKTYTGSIRSCINGELALDTPDGEQRIRLADIVKANLADDEFKIDKKMKHSRKKKGDAG